jgi:hypothetical protein
MFICVFLWSGDGADDTGRPRTGIEENDPGRGPEDIENPDLLITRQRIS